MSRNAKPRLYFSFRSPFSWMALRQLRERVPDADRRIEFIPYWDPDGKTEAALAERGSGFHYTQMSKAKHLYILMDTKRLAQRHGYAMTWPIDVDPWWELPHLGWLAARRQGTHEAFYAAVTAARWERGENVCERDVLHRVLTDAGLDADTLVNAPDDPAIRAEGVAALARAYDDDIFGIPYFKLGRHRFWGLDRLDDFLAAFEASVPPPVVEVPAVSSTMDSDTAGGCG